ncbi:RimJ/RimL family protein N-acetyltransferase [Allocatelliglobosispora scoriae]|uniref:RimJ/RimL family protein N-acetyltransferase n=1 Tax=Allocatelliglobosispora scoriae TaxID=643052 RepID=A0A841BZC5_9ACTN|nr:GNAT family protein [Allocatelliglobosispora scoriae]MBB5872152.1 RimJ/RimL family protein N-acetyltransferase [Allocatelliglobosispora scoriae]
MTEVAVRRFPHLTVSTPRLDVRQLQASDADEVGRIFGDKLVQRWLPFPSEFGQIEGKAWCTELATERRDSGAGDHYGIIRRDDQRLVGCLWTKRTDWSSGVTEVSYAVSDQVRGFGFAPEAVDALTLALILEHGFQRIELRVAPGNTASRRVAEKAGFTYEGLLRNSGFVHSGRVDLEVWSLVAADLRGSSPVRENTVVRQPARAAAAA